MVSSKVITRVICFGSSLLEAITSTIYSKGNTMGVLSVGSGLSGTVLHEGAQDEAPRTRRRRRRWGRERGGDIPSLSD